MRLLYLILLTVIQQSANAEIFKCVGKHGVASYQPSPCDTLIRQQQLDIKPDPAKEAAAKTRLDEVRSEYETRKATQLAEKKLAAEQSYRAAALEATRNKALAQQELAAAKRLQAQAIKHKRRQQDKRTPSHHRAKHATRKMW